MRLTRREFQRMAGGIVMLSAAGLPVWATAEVPIQPFAAQVERLLQAMAMIGDPLPEADVSRLRQLMSSKDEGAAVTEMQALLDRHVLLHVTLNPESRLSVKRGEAAAVLLQGGWRSFLIKVLNQAGTAPHLLLKSQQALPMGRRSSLAITGVHDFTNGAVDQVESRSRWLGINNWEMPPLAPTLSGLEVEYRLVQLYARDAGEREASIQADAGYGEQDLGYRSTVAILFKCLAAKKISLRIMDGDKPAVASLLVKDGLHRVYPPQTKREPPDLAFQPQVYRCDGETISLPEGKFTFEYGRGPEYLRGRMDVDVQAGMAAVPVRLERWIHPETFGHYSGDTHIHAAGCSHYESPTEGVTPDVMLRQAQGEGLDLGDVLNWGPGFEYQKQFFTGHALRPAQGTSLRYDVEVSGFPSSHCGHLVLLGLKQQIYPGAASVDDWPSWNLPILKWAKSQGAITGYAHSGHGLVVDDTHLPNVLMPPFNSSGANEFLVDVTHDGLVDFISGCDLWPFAELNVWYHTLNCGFRAAFAGETDFPCITDECVGGGRTYVKLDAPPAGDEGYSRWIEGLVNGPSYFGDGRSHIFNMKVESDTGVLSGRDLSMRDNGTVHVSAKACARLEPEITDRTKSIQTASPYDRPYWHVERARIGASRKVLVELVVNGVAVQHTEIIADGTPCDVRFDVKIAKSSWIALRVYPSIHTTPTTVTVNGAPVRASRASAKWCRQAVDVCWNQKAQRIRTTEIAEARQAYEHARTVYDRLITESTID